MNRSVRHARLFFPVGDYYAFEEVLREAVGGRFPVRLIAYCATPNQWHLVVRAEKPRDLSRFMHWVTMTHAQRWHAFHRSVGTGPVYQGRFKSVPIRDERQLLCVCRYVERNALGANLVERAEEWRWSSLWHRCRSCTLLALEPWNFVPLGAWLHLVNQR